MGVVNFIRHSGLFNPDNLKDEVHIIGLGATGSGIVSMLSRLGVPEMHCWDHDIVSDHNPPNSLVFTGNDIGRLKVDAVRDHLSNEFGTKIIVHPEKFESRSNQKLRGIVFLCVDDMDVRKDIWKKSIRYNPFIKLMVETRVGLELGFVHTVYPMRKTDVEGFEGTLYSSAQAEEPVCTAKIVITTTSIIAGIAAHKLVKYVTGEEILSAVSIGSPQVVPEGDESQIHSNATMFCLRPIIVTAATWQEEDSEIIVPS